MRQKFGGEAVEFLYLNTAPVLKKAGEFWRSGGKSIWICPIWKLVESSTLRRRGLPEDSALSLSGAVGRILETLRESEAVERSDLSMHGCRYCYK